MSFRIFPTSRVPLLAAGLVCTAATAQVPPAPAASAPADTTLPEVRARAAAESTAGPVTGYAARRSAVASKTDTPSIEAPQSISVIGREQLDDQAPVSVSEALRYAAGVVTEPWGQDYRNDQFVLRGFDAGTAGGLFRDGLPLKLYGNSGWRLEPYGIERIDVLRGPASALYGTATPGGLVMITSKQPLDEPLHEVGVTLGSHDRRQVELDLGGPLDAAGTWAYRLTGVARDSGTQTDRTPDDRLYLAPALTWRPSGRTTLTLTGLVQRDRTNSSAYLPAFGTRDDNPLGRLPPSRYTGEAGDHYDQDQAAFGWSFEHRLDDAWAVRQNARVGRIDLDYRTVYLAGLVADENGTPVDGRTAYRYAYGVDERTTTAAVDTQAQWQGRAAGLGHTVLFGIDLLRDRQDGASVFGTGPTLDVYAPVYGTAAAAPAPFRDVRDHQAQTGAYLQDQVRFGPVDAGGRERWIATLGLRHDRSHATRDDRLGSTDIDQRDDATTGRAGVVYLADDGWAPYASFSTAFNPVLGATFAGVPFVPERSRQWEAGLRWQPDGRRMSASAAVFRIDKRNALTNDTDTGHAFAQVQTGAVRSQGVELEAQGEFTRGWTGTAAYTYTDAEVTRSNDGNVGKALERVPRHGASAWIEHTRRAGAALLGLGGGLRHVGKTWSDAANTASLPSYTLLDLGAWLDGGTWRASLNVANATDREVLSVCYNDSADAICSYGTTRRVTASLRYRW